VVLKNNGSNVTSKPKSLQEFTPPLTLSRQVLVVAIDMLQTAAPSGV